MILEKMYKDNKFTPAELEIVKFLIENKENLSGITIHQLAKETYSSNATIIRLCKKLGFKGFRDFYVAFEKELESNKYTIGETVDYTQPFSINESTEEIIGNIYTLYNKSLAQVQSSINYDELEKIANRIHKSKRVFLYGYGDVKLTLRMFVNMLNKIGVFPVLATENGEEGYISSNITKEDCAVFVTYSCKHEKIQLLANTLRKNSVPIIVITANSESILVKYSESCIIVPDMERPERIATFYSQLVFEYILSLIYALIYRKLNKK